MIEVRIDDLAFYEGEAIAWPVDASLGATTPLLRRVEQAGGDALAKRAPLVQPLPVGAAVVTTAGDLGVELLIHAVVGSHEERITRDTVRRALVSAMQRAVDFQIGELAVAPFGIGAGNLDVEDSADVMVGVLQQHVARAPYPRSIVVIVENPVEEAAWRAALALTRGTR
ncbi:MAG TPA: macro domain-containing protein [Gemmatimonadaceae bacterium]|nr:macro domain-containing protein [Gemmatimonadaceae bacterium]